VPVVAIVPPVSATLDEPAAAVTIPVPQVPVSPLGVDTTRPAGNGSVKATPVSAIEALEFVIVKLSGVEAARPIEAAPNDLLMLGGVPTVKFAVAVLPVPPLVELTAPVVFVNDPGVLPVTFTLKLQFAPAAIVPPLRLSAPDPAAAVIVPAQELANPFGVAIVIPVGNVSVNATPVNATEFAAGFVIVKLSEDVPFGEIAIGLNALAIEGGAMTEIEAVAVPPAPPSVEVTFPVTLFCVPATIPVTLTEKVHDALAARFAPDKLTAPPPCAAVIVPPPQLPVSPLGVETTNPPGSTSANPTPVSAVVALLF
jgi:hypothetical protein